jgi:hypothetical protein
MLSKFGKLITDKLDHVLASHGYTFSVTRDLLDRNLFLNGQIAAAQVRRLDRIATLASAEFRVTSQWGEDGIIEWLCHKLPEINRSFIEFGVENYSEANTRFLLRNRGWRGLILDGSAANVDYVRNETIHWMHDLVAVKAFITAENINELIEVNKFAGPLGILSIDIDGNDYWVLKAIECVDPAIIIAEINGVLGDIHSITIPYDPAFERLKAHWSGQYFGASVKAMIELATERGYTFIGTNSNGVNAFFVRNDLAGPVCTAIGEVKAWPARHRDSRDANGVLTYVGGQRKADLISGLPVHNFANGTAQSIESLYPLYSAEWASQLQ